MTKKQNQKNEMKEKSSGYTGKYANIGYLSKEKYLFFIFFQKVSRLQKT